MEQLIHQNAYLIVIAMIIFSGEAGLFTGFAFVATGRMSLIEVIAIGKIVSFLGNMNILLPWKVSME